MELVSRVVAELKHKRIAEARHIADSALLEIPDDWHAIYAKALVNFETEQFKAALNCFQQVAEKKPNFKPNLSNLALTLHRLEQFEEAERVLRKSLQLDSTHWQTNLTLAYVLRDTQRQDEAKEIIQQLHNQNPPNAELEALLGDVLRLQGKWLDAARAYKRAKKLNPNYCDALIHLAFIALSLGRLEDAKIECEAILQMQPNHLAALIMLGRAYTAEERFDEAMECFAEAYDEATPNANLCAHIGEVWALKGEQKEASQWFLKALGLKPKQYDAVVGMATLINEMENAEAALTFLEQRDDQESEIPPTYLLLKSDLLWEEGDAFEAIRLLKIAKKREPHRAAIHARIGKIHSSKGDIKKAEKAYQQALTENPNCVPAINGLATLNKKALDTDLIANAEALYLKGSKRQETAATLANTLSYHYDAIGEYEKAAGMMQEANKLQWSYRSNRDWNYSPEVFEKLCDSTIETFNADYMKSIHCTNTDIPTPVFVVSMPRSGTTLTEQILARHAQVLGVGERNFASRSLLNARLSVPDSKGPYEFLPKLLPDDLALLKNDYLSILQNLIDKHGEPSMTRVVDKMPDNYSNLGWILTLFPNASIIHVQRDPRDVALSCWQTQFGSINWACHTEHIVHRIQCYQRMMAHWRQVIPERFLEINYEDLVNNQKSISRSMIEWIGLEWDDACLDFQSSDRLVRTASITQVRKPMYKTSVAKWRRYEALIPELFEPLTF